MPTRNFRQLIEAMPPARRQAIEKRFQESLASMPLDALRKAREMTQLQLGEIGANANAVNPDSNRAIIFEALASPDNPEATVRLLLDFGANPNVTAILEAEHGPTSPLVRAAEMGRWVTLN